MLLNTPISRRADNTTIDVHPDLLYSHPTPFKGRKP
jgi:hypothetical protein